jgi:ribosomal protein S18 acetylase RimI-like enzyme
VRVIVPFRGRGIGRALTEHAVDQAQQHDIRAFYAWAWVEPETDEAHAGRPLASRRASAGLSTRRTFDRLTPR